ncbi:uncharacterized protein BXZ73DRAFT_96098 [Epithele typhae]|uniref:uncharacterized protein n=1 Tax=Epithele typhae TaxID=378194 RepID=UPI002008A7EF|nr:uncharacterized protein BXZ73DRAFT_96098 [Epithele typhae]KAH9945107.1 hypothetical protein BXZ73DRAFT_96098 [Epithele typhae]
MPRTGDYIALQSSDESLPTAGNVQPVYYHTDRLVFWATVGVLCSTLVVIATAAGLLESPAPPPVISDHRPNPYVHLDVLLQNATLDWKPFVNFPPVALQFKTSDTSRRLSEEGRDHPTDFGKVYPDDRHVVANSTHSTVLQFRNMDYLMERCVLHWDAPRFSAGFPNPDIRIDPSPARVDVWLLEREREMSRYLPGSTDFAPARRRLLTTMAVADGAPSESVPFVCPSQKYTTVELTCPAGGGACGVDFWQNRRVHPPGGIFMKQHPYRASGKDMV